MTISAEQLAALAATCLENNKARQVVSLDVRGLSNVADFMIVATATSSRHAKSLADKVWEAAKAAGNVPIGMEGEVAGEWVLLDLGEVIVHVMLEEVRAHYQLEKLWNMKPSERA